MKNYFVVIPELLRHVKSGALSIKNAADIMGCDSKTVKNYMKDYGIEFVPIGTGRNRREAAIANQLRNELLTNLAKPIKYDDADINVLAEQNTIPIRTLYRWIHRV